MQLHQATYYITEAFKSRLNSFETAMVSNQPTFIKKQSANNCSSSYSFTEVAELYLEP